MPHNCSHQCIFGFDEHKKKANKITFKLKGRVVKQEQSGHHSFLINFFLQLAACYVGVKQDLISLLPAAHVARRGASLERKSPLVSCPH